MVAVPKVQSLLTWCRVGIVSLLVIARTELAKAAMGLVPWVSTANTKAPAGFFPRAKSSKEVSGKLYMPRLADLD